MGMKAPTAATQKAIQSPGRAPIFGNSACRFVDGRLTQYGPGQDVPASLKSKKRMPSTIGEELRSKDKETRLGAVEKLKGGRTNGAEWGALEFAATYGEHADVREASVEALAGKRDALERVAKYNVSDSGGIAAVKRIEDDYAGYSPAIDTCLPETKARETSDVLENIAKHAGRENVAAAAVMGIAFVTEHAPRVAPDVGVVIGGWSGKKLAEIACSSNHPAARMAAFRKINSVEGKLAVVAHSIYADSRNCAIDDLVGRGMKFTGEKTREMGIPFTGEQLGRVEKYLAAKKAVTEERASSDAELFDSGLEKRIAPI